MHDLLLLGGISVGNFRKVREKRPEKGLNGPKKAPKRVLLNFHLGRSWLRTAILDLSEPEQVELALFDGRLGRAARLVLLALKEVSQRRVTCRGRTINDPDLEDSSYFLGQRSCVLCFEICIPTLFLTLSPLECKFQNK